mgnify:FL=1
MMRRALLQRLPLLAAALAPLLGPTATRAQGNAKVWLRVRNSSQAAFTHVWQGLPQQGADVDLGPLLPRDEVSDAVLGKAHDLRTEAARLAGAA